MSQSQILLYIVFVPVIGAFILPLLGRFSASLRNIAGFGLVAVSFLGALSLIPSAVSANPAEFTLSVNPLISFSLRADGLAAFTALASSLIGLIIILYSFSYISHYPNQNEYYAMVVLFLGSMMGIVFSQNLLFLYIFWELTAICSWRLIGFFRAKGDVLRADKAFLITFSGAILMLLGFISIFQASGSFDLSACRAYFSNNPLPRFAVILILAGIFSKSATLPFQTWLLDAGVAPSPVTALLHAAVLVKIGVYLFARIFVATLPLVALWHTAIPLICGVSALIAAGAALVEKDFKRIVAYSTISQIGFIFFAFSIGNETGFIAGLLYILMHGLAKAGLFLSAGIVEQKTYTRDITQLGGLIKGMPVTAVSFLICAFSVMGVPPLGGFFSKYLVFASSIESGQVWIPLLFLSIAVLTVVYLFRLFNLVFLGTAQVEAKEGSKGMVFSVALLAVLSLAAGILIRFPFDFARAAAGQIFLK